MTDVVEKQVKDLLTRFKTEIQKAASQSSKSGNQIANGLQGANTQITALLTTTQKLAADGTLTETRKGYDSLGRSIVEVCKNGQLLNRTIKEDSSLELSIQKANKLYQEQAGLLKKLYALKTQRLKTDDGTLSAKNLDLQIASTNRLIDANKQLIKQMSRQAVNGTNLTKLAKEEAELKAKYTSAQLAQQDKLNAAKKAEADKAASGVNELKQVQEAYSKLTTAYKQYNAAVKNGNEAGQAYWSQSAQDAMVEIRSIEQKIGSLNIEEDTRKKIISLIEQAKNAEATHNKQVEDGNRGLNKMDQTLNSIGSRLLQMATTMLVLRGLQSIWSSAIDYAQQYYDQMNEIRIVSGKSQTEINR
ncbi:MAG: hypothetical protein J6K55_14130 [Clostridia bacterium]|nr:hypothetical protein [Clostridia bacterium]